MNTYQAHTGVIGRVEECAERPVEVDCSCCGGSGEHATGEGTAASVYPCGACGGKGYFKVVEA